LDLEKDLYFFFAPSRDLDTHTPYTTTTNSTISLAEVNYSSILHV